MRRQSAISLLILFSAAVGCAQGNTSAKLPRPDLAGTWELDRTKSDLTDDERYGLSLNEVSLTILDRDPRLELTRRFHTAKSDSESHFLFYTDGRGETNTAASGQDAIKSNTHWEGTKLISRYTLRRAVAWNKGVIDNVDVIDEWSVSGDGKILTLKTTMRYLLRGVDAEHGAPFKGYVPRLWLKRVYIRAS